MDITTKKIIDFIKQYRADHGMGPSIDEIAEVAGISRSAVGYRVQIMVAGNVLKRGPQHRSLDVADAT
jgi:DNA-binding Lrp family transcriptional regulator